MLRSILAILAGFAYIAITSIGADMVLHNIRPDLYDANGRVEETWALLLMIGYVTFFAITGTYLTGRLAPGRPMQHALILGLLGLLMSVVGTIMAWEMAPAWFHIVMLALVLPIAWVGGKIAEARSGAVAMAQ